VTRRALVVLVVALVLLRFAAVASMSDVFGYGEEFGKGAAAKAMLDHLPIAHYRLAYGYHEGGGFAITHLKALLFALMGPSVLADKVGALLTCVLLFWVAVAFAREHLGERTAFVFAAFFLLAPLEYVRFSLLNLGTHFEALVFVVLVLHFALRLGRDGEPRRRDALLLGLWSGFGLWFSLMVAPAIAAAGAWIVMRKRRHVGMRTILSAFLGFAIGALPLWIMLALAGREALIVRGHDSLGGGPGFFASLFGMLAPIATSHDVMTWALTIATLIAIGAGVLLRGTAAHTLAFLYFDVYALMYAASGLALVYDPDAAGSFMFLLRLAPFWLFASMLAAHGVAVLWGERNFERRALAAVMAGMVLVSGACDFVALCRTGRPDMPLANLRLLARTKGYAYSEYFDKLKEHIPGDLADKCRMLRHYRDDPRTLDPAIAQSLFVPADRSAGTEEVADAVARCRAWFGAEAPDAWRGLGRFLVGWTNDQTAAFARIEALGTEPLSTGPPDAGALGADACEPLAEGIGRAGLGPKLLISRVVEQLAQPPPQHLRDAWLRGCGWRVHQIFRFRPDLAQAFLERCDVLQRLSLQRGYDEARAADSL
jgi:hypothetical protein